MPLHLLSSSSTSLDAVQARLDMIEAVYKGRITDNLEHAEPQQLELPRGGDMATPAPDVTAPRRLSMEALHSPASPPARVLSGPSGMRAGSSARQGAYGRGGSGISPRAHSPPPLPAGGQPPPPPPPPPPLPHKARSLLQQAKNTQGLVPPLPCGPPGRLYLLDSIPSTHGFEKLAVVKDIRPAPQVGAPLPRVPSACSRPVVHVHVPELLGRTLHCRHQPSALRRRPQLHAAVPCCP